MANRKYGLKEYGDVFGRFIRKYLDSVRPNIEKGDFERAAEAMECLRGDYNALGDGRRGGGRNVANAYKNIIDEFLKVLDRMSFEEAREYFRDERVKKSLLSMIKTNLLIIDKGMSSRKKKNEAYERHRKAFERRLEFI